MSRNRTKDLQKKASHRVQGHAGVNQVLAKRMAQGVSRAMLEPGLVSQA
jgi:hypothetical protein